MTVDASTVILPHLQAQRAQGKETEEELETVEVAS